jgi:hypothetical protein
MNPALRLSPNGPVARAAARTFTFLSDVAGLQSGAHVSTMNLWHLTPDAARTPEHPQAGQRVCVYAGTWPIALGQSVWASCTVEHADGTLERRVQRALWVQNEGANSYWCIELGTFRAGDRVSYTVLGEDGSGDVVTGESSGFDVVEAERIVSTSFEERVEEARQPSPPAAAGHRASALHR